MTSLATPFFYLATVVLAVLGALEIFGQIGFVNDIREGEQAYRGELRALVFYGWLVLGSFYGLRASKRSASDQVEVQETYAGIGLFMGLIFTPILQIIALVVDFSKDRQVDWGLQGTVLLLVLMLVSWIAFILTSLSSESRSAAS